MDLLKKIETLLNATARAGLPRRGRHSVLDEQEGKLLAEMREALAAVEVEERKMAERLKVTRARAEEAAEQGDWDEQRAQERMAAEMERQLERESIQAINLEEKLTALEEKLALAREAVEKEAQKAARKDEAATKVLAQNDKTPIDEVDLETRKSRLSG